MRPEEFALAHVGDGYLYGAKGQKCTPQFRRMQAQQYPQYTDNIMNTGAKWDGRPVWDCAQLTRYAWKEAGVDLPSGATSQWQKTDWADSGTIDTLPQSTVCSLFRYADGRMQHTGLYLGDGTCVHAKTTQLGVVHETMGHYLWTHWAVPVTAGVSSEPTQIFRAKVTGGGLWLRREPQNNAQRLVLMPQDTVIGVTQASGGWYRTAYEGKRGWCRAEFTRRLGITARLADILALMVSGETDTAEEALTELVKELEAQGSE